MTSSIGRIIRTVLTVTVLAAGPATAAVKTHTVVKGDTLWDLAERYYREPFQWPLIADANPPPDVHDPHWIYPGQILVIPGLSTPDPVEASVSLSDPEPAAYPAPEESVIQEGLSAVMPTGMTGQWPSVKRIIFDKDWRTDGKVELFDDDMEQAAATGDYVYGRFEPNMTILVGDRFSVYRMTSRFESEPQDLAIRVQKIAEVEARRDMRYGKWRLLITKSAGTVQLSDMLKRDIQ